MKKFLLALIILSIGGILFYMGFKVSSPSVFFDGLSIMVILVFTVIPLLWSSSMKDILLGLKVILTDDDTYTLEQLKNSYDAYDMLKKALFTSVAFATVVGIVLLLSQLEDLSQFGPMLAVIFLTLLYVSILNAFILPIQLKLKKAINMR